MLVEVWSDIVCPWCYIGRRRLERALQGYPDATSVTTRFRSFELDPERAPHTGETLDRMLAGKYGVSMEQARTMNERVTRLAAAEGIEFRLDIARPGNTFDAHRLAHLAVSAGLGERVMERFQAGYFCEGASIADRTVLAELATEAGLDTEDVRATLASDRYADEVRADEALAATLGIRGVPFFVVDRRLGVSGAQEPDVLRAALGQARQDARRERTTEA